MVFCIDYSGSMPSNGGANEVKQAMSTLLNADKAKQYMLQLTSANKVVVIPFNSERYWIYRRYAYWFNVKS